MKMETQPVSIAPNSGAHIRSRITVVCAECKRLKLKCDRRTPCSSCIKRDTVPRCLYSAAAAEKIDIQSLHNRVLTLESQISQIASQSFPSHPGPGSANPRSFLNDRNIVAAGSSGSSIIISLDDVAGIWLDALDLNSGDEQILLTPQQPALLAGATTSHVFTDLDFNKFRIPSTFADPGGGLGVTPALVQLLPQNLTVREELLRQLETTLDLHPCVNFPHFKGRILELYKYAASAALPNCGKGSVTGIPNGITNVGKSAASRARSASTSFPVVESSDSDPIRPSTSATSGANNAPIPRPSLSFFSAAAAAFALSARILGSTPLLASSSTASANQPRSMNASGGGTATGTSGPGGSSAPSGQLEYPPTSIPSQQPLPSSSSQQSGASSNSGLTNGLGSMNLQGGLGIMGGMGGATVSSQHPSPPGHSPLAPGKSPSVPSPPGVPSGPATGRPATAHSFSHPSPSTQSQANSSTSSIPHSPLQHAASLIPTPSSLFTLSIHALTMHELSSSYDLDYLVALLFQVLFLLYDNGGLRNPSVPQILFPMVGKMVNIARMMGLWVDPSEVGSLSVGQGSRYGLFETEMRRRIWWDIYFYDLFVSDAMGQSPLIQDDLATCSLPTDVNEEQFSPSSTSLPHPSDNAKSFTYFPIKCRLAQLVKGMKKRTFRDPFHGGVPTLDPNGGDLSIDAAIAFESEVAAWIAELPPKFRLNMLEEDVNLLIQNGNPILIAQQCEIMTVTSRLVIKIFVPFLRRASKANDAPPQGLFGQPVPPAATKTPHHAIHACVNAAHTIIHASKVAHMLYKQRANSIRAESLFYSFGRQIFDAAVISAHSVITSPQSLFAKVAMEDVRVAVEIMKDPITSVAATSPFRVGLEGAPGEALKIVEILQYKAEAARSGSGAPVLGQKRKHSEVEGSLRAGFQLPYVGGGVYTSFSGGDPSDGRTVMSAGSESGAGRAKYERREGHASRDRGSKASYPAIGVRVRTNSGKSSDSGPLAEGKGKNKAPQVPTQVTPNLPPAQVQRNSISGPSGSSASEATFSPPPPTTPATQTPIQSQADYGQMVSPVGYRPEDEAMMHYNSQPPPEYPQNPPPSSHGMYDYGGPSSAGPSPTGAPYYQQPQYANANSMYSQPPHSSHGHMTMPPPPMLGLATHQMPESHGQMEPSPVSMNGTPRDARFSQQTPDNRQEQGVEQMVPVQYDVPQPQNGWMDDGGRFSHPPTTNPGWNSNFYWKAGQP